MTHNITLTEEQYQRLQYAASARQETLEQVVADLVAGLPAPKPPISDEEYERRWDEFMTILHSMPDEGAPFTNEDIDEAIGEEAADTHEHESDTNPA